MKEFYNLRWVIQHLIDENEYQYDDNEWTNPLSESNWRYQTNQTLMKYVNFILKEMTPEQMKQNPITVHPNQKLDTEEGESNTNEQESTISCFSCHMNWLPWSIAQHSPFACMNGEIIRL